MKSINIGYHVLQNFIPALISLACFSFVAVEIHDRVNKYLEEPVANSVTIEGNEGLLFPQITLCPSVFGHGITTKILKKCNLTPKMYEEGNWIGTCADPEQRYSSMVMDFKMLITKTNDFTIKNGNKFRMTKGAIYEINDSPKGRCYSIVPNDNVLNQGIVETSLETAHEHLIIHLSPNGEFLTGKYG